MIYLGKNQVNMGTPINPEVIQNITEDWLEDHFTSTTGYVVDNTLSISGAAADAKATGDAIKSLGITGASAGDIIKVKTVDQNGVPTEWESFESFPKKVFEYELTGNWHKINITAIDYSTGVLTLASNEAPFTNDYSTTIRVSVVPLIEGFDAPFQYGMIPPELLGELGYGVLVGTNQIKLYTGASTSIDSITNTGIINLNRIQLWAELSRNRWVNGGSLSGISANHRYRIKCVFPYGMCHFVAGYWLKRRAGISAEVKYGEGYGNGYASTSVYTLNWANANATVYNLNNYETISLRSIYNNGKFIFPFPISFTGDLYRISQNAWRLDTVAHFFTFGTSNPSNNNKPNVRTIVDTLYLNGAVYTIETAFNGNANTCFDGAKLTVFDLGEEY